ncbi:MAG: DMT family transporter [Cyanobacteria bacterium P01_D01_bin.44]
MSLQQWCLLSLLSLLWGGSFLFIELSLLVFEPLTIVFVRLAIAAILLHGVVYLSGQRLPRSPRIWLAFAGMGILNNLIPFGLIIWGQQHITASLASILNATTPIFTVILANWLTSDEKLTTYRLLGVALGFSGVVVLMGPEILGGLSFQSIGQFAILGAALSYGFAAIYGRQFKAMPSKVAAAGIVTTSSIMVFPLALLESPLSVQISLVSGVALFCLGLLSTGVAYLIFYHLLAKAGATYTSLVTFLIPLSAVILGVLILGERLSGGAIAGMILILAGLLVIDGRLLRKWRA